jgi:prepilin-type N-terminal cleavage/methylation domain-containing protein
MRTRNTAFTLMELLIVIVILAILAAAIIPQFADVSVDAKDSTADLNVRILRAQIELYKAQHDGLTPSLTLAELTKATDASGADGGPFGPYLQRIPVNPFTNSATVRQSATNPPAAASGAADAGYLYHPATGRIWLDKDDHLTK